MYALCYYDTSTTQLHTYGHTLSLHAAPPIHPPEDTNPTIRPLVERHDCAKLPARHTASRLFSCIHSSYFGHGGSQIRQFYVVSSRSNHLIAKKAQPFDSMGEANNHGLELRSEEHTSELQSLMRISYAVFCLKKKNNTIQSRYNKHNTHKH